MDPTQLKASYDQSNFLSQEIHKVDSNLLKTQAQQSAEIIASQERGDWASENRQNRNTQFVNDNVNGSAARLSSDLNRNTQFVNDNLNRNTQFVNDNVNGSAARLTSDLHRNTQFVNDNINDKSARLTSDVNRNSQFVNDNINGSSARLTSDLHRNADFVNDNINGSYSRLTNDLHRNTQFVNDNVNDKSARVTSDVNRSGTDNLLATERVGVRLDDNNYRNTMSLDDAIHRTAMDIKTTMASSELENQKSTNELIMFIKQNADQNWKAANESTRDILGTKSDILLSSTNQFAALAKQASENTAIIQIEALKSKADLAKQMAFEYSSLKDILAKQEADKLRDDLRSSEHKSLYFELKNGHRHHHHGRRHHH
jgi:hypothetical protein